MAQTLSKPASSVSTQPPICAQAAPQQAGPVAGTSNAETQTTLGLGASGEVDFMAEMAAEYGGGGAGGGSLASALPYLGFTAPVALDAVPLDLAFSAAAENLAVPSVMDWVLAQSLRDLFTVPSRTVFKLLDAVFPDGTYAELGIGGSLAALLGAGAAGEGALVFARQAGNLVTTLTCKAEGGMGGGADYTSRSAATGQTGILLKFGVSAGADVEVEWRRDLQASLAGLDGLAGSTLGGLGLASFFHGVSEALLEGLSAQVPQRLIVAGSATVGAEGQVGGTPDVEAPDGVTGGSTWELVKLHARTGLQAAVGADVRQGSGWEGLRGVFFLEAAVKAEAAAGGPGDGTSVGGENFVRIDIKSPTLGGDAPDSAEALMREGAQIRVTTGFRQAGEEESKIREFAALPEALAVIAGAFDEGTAEHGIVGQLVDGRKHRVSDVAAVQPILAHAGLEPGELATLGSVTADIEIVVNELAVGVSGSNVDLTDEEVCREDQREMARAVFGVGEASLAVEHKDAWEIRKAEVDVRTDVGFSVDTGQSAMAAKGGLGRKLDLADQLELEQVAQLLIA